MNYYSGVRAFKAWKRQNNPDASFDWADLSEQERKIWAKREQEKSIDTQGDSV